LWENEWFYQLLFRKQHVILKNIHNTYVELFQYMFISMRSKRHVLAYCYVWKNQRNEYKGLNVYRGLQNYTGMLIVKQNLNHRFPQRITKQNYMHNAHFLPQNSLRAPSSHCSPLPPLCSPLPPTCFLSNKANFSLKAALIYYFFLWNLV